MRVERPDTPDHLKALVPLLLTPHTLIHSTYNLISAYVMLTHAMSTRVILENVALTLQPPVHTSLKNAFPRLRAHPPVCGGSSRVHAADISIPLPVFNVFQLRMDNGVNTTVHHRLEVETPLSPRQIRPTPRPQPTRRQQPSLPNPQIRLSSSFMDNLYSFNDGAPENFDGDQVGNPNS